MPSLAEIKAEVRPRVARIAIEKLVPSLSLKEVESPSLEHAWQLDREGKWQEAANEFYTIWQKGDLGTRAEAGIIGLPQMLINLGRFGQARKWLRKEPWQIIYQFEWMEENKNEGCYYRARRLEKLAWIDDYEGDFREEINRLNRARQLIREIPEEKKGKREEELLSTTTHFLGRAHLGLAFQGIDKEENTKIAIDYFEKDLACYQKLREKGEARPSGEGFNHGWLARCYMELGEEEKAEREIELARYFFQEHINENPESGVDAHYYLLKGRLAVVKGEIKKARSHFEEALRVRLEIEPYRKGEADAAIGIAWSYMAEGKYGAAFSYFRFALKKYPLFLLRGFF